jgi:hypothetical protein
MIRRHWPALSIAAAVFAAGLNLQAQPPAATPPTASTSTTPAPTADVNLKELIARQAALEKQYKAFTTSLLSLAQKLEKSDRIEDKDKAKALRKAIDLADKEGVDNKFTTLLRTLTKEANNISLSDIASAKNQNDDLIKVLKEILSILQSDDELDRIRGEIKYLTQLLAELNAIIRQTNINQARVDSNKGEPKQLAKDQGNLAKKVDELANKMGNVKPKSGDGEAKGGEKGEGKPGDDNAGENKDDTKDPKVAEREPGDKNDPAKSDGADSKPSKDPMAGSASEGSKSPPKDGASAGSKAGGMKDPMAGEKSNKPAETRNKEDNKGDEKGAAIGAKGAKSDAQASAGKGAGSPSGGSPSGQPKPSGGSPSPGNPPPNAPKAPGSDNVRRAVPDEENAAGALDENKRPKASDHLGDAAENLRKAREELEKRLKQLREQELERILANLEARVNKTLAMQIEVKSATVAIHAQILKHPEKKAQPVDFQNAQKQEDKEGEIIAEADKAIQLLISEGSAVAFPAVFEEVRKDMLRVKERLHDANVGEDTQGIEQDIIEALTHMRDALKKAQQELGKSPPGPPGNPPDGPQLQKLLDMIAELKMIRQLQVQVNDRTKRYGIRNGTNVEQADDPQIKKELRDLSDRQDRLETMVNNIVTKKNQ